MQLYITSILLLFARATLAASPDCPPGTPVCPDYCGNNYSIPALSASLQQEWSLKQVQVIIRHGSRTPVKYSGSCFAGYSPANFSCTNFTDLLASSFDSTSTTADVHRLFRSVDLGYPGAELLPGNCPSGVLLAEGYRQQIANGQRLKDAYVGSGRLLGNDSLTAQQQYMEIRSSNNERCLASARGVLDGMFAVDPAMANQQVVNVLVQDADNDALIGSDCPKYWNALTQSNVFQFLPNVCTQERAALQAVTDASNTVTANSDMFDCTMSYACNNLQLPATITPSVVDSVASLGATLVSCMYNSPGVAMTAAGNLFGILNQHFSDVINGASPLKFVLYSAHDITLLPIKAGLGILKQGPDSWPGYGSLMSMELYQSNAGKYAVRIIFNGEVQNVPLCGAELCPWELLSPLMRALVPTKQACQADAAATNASNNQGAVTGLAVAFCFTAVWAAAVTYQLWRKTTGQQLLHSS